MFDCARSDVVVAIRDHVTFIDRTQRVDNLDGHPRCCRWQPAWGSGSGHGGSRRTYILCLVFCTLFFAKHKKPGTKFTVFPL